jgi:hypothetical protein
VKGHLENSSNSRSRSSERETHVKEKVKSKGQLGSKSNKKVKCYY